MRAAGFRTGGRLVLLAVLLVGGVGCRHKAKVAVVAIPPPQQLPVNTTAEVAQPQPLVPKVPLQPTPLPAVTVPTKKKARRPRKVASPVVPPPASPAPGQAAGTGPVAEVNPIGALTPGGSQGPQLRKQATELIFALEKRLAAIPKDKKEQQKDQIVRVMDFRRRAQMALDAGDSDGAVTLAIKAKLLLDDLLK